MGYPVMKGSPGPAPGPSPGPSPPSPPSPPPPPSSTHYEHPPCRSDETEAMLGTSGELCAPQCDASGSCPTDVPAGTTAKPACILQESSSGKKFCGLQCFLGGCP